MATSAELWSNYMELQRQANVSPDSFYNKSFVDRINDAQKNIDLMVEEKNQADSKRMQAQDAYDTFDGQMRNYSSMQDEAENKYGVTTAMENYEKSKYAVAAMEQTLSSLPSTINRTSNVVMSQQRRELAYNTQANKWEQSMRTKQAITDVNKDVWDNARKMSNEYAQQLYGEQESTREALSLQWSNATSEYQKSIDRWQDARTMLTELKSDYRSWQWQQASIANAYARAKAQDAFNQYMLQYNKEMQSRLETYAMEQAASDYRIAQIHEQAAQRRANSYLNYQEKQSQANVAKSMSDNLGILGRYAYLYGK